MPKMNELTLSLVVLIAIGCLLLYNIIKPFLNAPAVEEKKSAIEKPGIK